MTKINQKEYEILKGLDDKWKWIAREGEYGGLIFCFREKPHKDIRSGEWGPDATQYKYLGGYDSLFQFIQWEDEEPHNIAELIEEYEHKEFYDYVGWKYAESEETEMKKDLDWLNNELEKVIKDVESDDISFAGKKDYDEGYIDSIRDVQSIVNQLNEPETVEETTRLLENVLKENKRLGKLLEEKHEEWLDLMDIINNRETETLSPKWVDDNSVYASSDGVTEEYVHVDDLKELLVPKQDEREQLEIAYKDILSRKEFLFDDKRYVVVERPTIPKFVAEAIEEDKECGYDVYESIDLILGTNGGGLPSISDWVARNIDKYANAWLNGFTVEKEPLYRARLKVITDEFIASYLRTQSSDAEDRLKALEIGSKYTHEDYRHLSEFTEDELKRLDIWDSKQWELEEMEE